MLYELEKFIIIFTSNYHGYYIEELFRRNKIKSTMKKAPRALGKSCNTALYIAERDLERAVELVVQTKIPYEGIFEIVNNQNVYSYKKVVYKKDEERKN
ncbi:MAG: DUF3343 domain-containing protein [Bacillota bacterium]